MTLKGTVKHGEVVLLVCGNSGQKEEDIKNLPLLTYQVCERSEP